MKQPDGHIHVVPERGPEHHECKDCWCNPTLSYVDEETKREVWVHKGYEELEN